MLGTRRVVGNEDPERPPSCKVRLAAASAGRGPLSRRYRARCCLYGVSGPLRDFKKVRSKSQDRSLIWKCHWKWLKWAQNVDG